MKHKEILNQIEQDSEELQKEIKKTVKFTENVINQLLLMI